MMKINYLLAALAALAGTSAAFTNHAEKTGLYPTWKFDEQRLEGEKIRLISAIHLADLLYTKHKAIVLVDFRSDSAYREYHIPSAIQPAQFGHVDSDKSGMIVCYGTDPHSISSGIPDGFQADLFVLGGGIRQWYDQVLFPDFEKYQVRNKNQLEEIISKSRYFGGSPRNLLELNIDQRTSQFREGC